MTQEQLIANIKADKYGTHGNSFFEDLVELFGLDPADKRTSKMYSLAWENGHAYGYLEVFYHFQDLVEVFKS